MTISLSLIHEAVGTQGHMGGTLILVVASRVGENSTSGPQPYEETITNP